MNTYLNIEVAFATPQQQTIIPLTVTTLTGVVEAINLSQIQQLFPEYKLTDLPIGIFGKRIDHTNYQLRNGDRIEIYRLLNKTPNQRRLDRAHSKG